MKRVLSRAATVLLLGTVALVPTSTASAADDDCLGPIKDVKWRGYLAFGEHVSATITEPGTNTRWGFAGPEGLPLKIIVDENTYQGPVAVINYWINGGSPVPPPTCVTGTGEFTLPPIAHRGHQLFIVAPAGDEVGTFAFTMVVDR